MPKLYSKNQLEKMQQSHKLRRQLEGISFVQLLDGITRIKKRKTIYKKEDKLMKGDRRFHPKAVRIPNLIPDTPKAPIVRPPAEYSNSSHYGIASEMLKEQLKTTG